MGCRGKSSVTMSRSPKPSAPHDVGLGSDDEVRPVILRDLRALQRDQELATLAVVRTNHACIRDRLLPEVDDSATGRCNEALCDKIATWLARCDAACRLPRAGSATLHAG